MRTNNNLLNESLSSAHIKIGENLKSCGILPMSITHITCIENDKSDLGIQKLQLIWNILFYFILFVVKKDHYFHTKEVR